MGHPEGGSFWLSPWDGGVSGSGQGGYLLWSQKNRSPNSLLITPPITAPPPLPAKSRHINRFLYPFVCLKPSLSGVSLSLRWLGFHAWLQVLFQVPAGLSSAVAVLYTILPGSDLPLPGVCGVGVGTMARLSQYLHLYEPRPQVSGLWMLLQPYVYIIYFCCYLISLRVEMKSFQGAPGY